MFLSRPLFVASFTATVVLSSRPPGEQLNLQETIAKFQQLVEQTTNQTARRRRVGETKDNNDNIIYKALMDSDIADPSQEWDQWAQAYRTLGAFIDCDDNHKNAAGDHERRNVVQNGHRVVGSGCTRWMMWAMYVNPNYQGNKYDEYFSDEPYSNLDCHRSDTEWQLMGVYRQEFYQYLEQISKHLWAIDDYEYIVARAGLMYMTDYDCYQVGFTGNRSTAPVYSGIQPMERGRFQLALYSDKDCLHPDDSLGTYDDYVPQTQIDLGDNNNDAYDKDTDHYFDDWWHDAQEDTLTNLNDVYNEFLYCTLCMDYPSFQDGYFIGDYGIDDDDIINQCGVFRQDSLVCKEDCLLLGDEQRSITSVNYGGQQFGQPILSDYSSSSRDGSFSWSSPTWSQIANAFLLLFSIILLSL